MTVKDETVRFVGILSNLRSSGTDTSSPLRGASPQGEATAETNEPIDPKDFIDIARPAPTPHHRFAELLLKEKPPQKRTSLLIRRFLLISLARHRITASRNFAFRRSLGKRKREE